MRWIEALETFVTVSCRAIGATGQARDEQSSKRWALDREESRERNEGASNSDAEGEMDATFAPAPRTRTDERSSMGEMGY
jgi:hypothetical protein